MSKTPPRCSVEGFWLVWQISNYGFLRIEGDRPQHGHETRECDRFFPTFRDLRSFWRSHSQKIDASSFLALVN